MHELIELILKDISAFGSAVADKDASAIKQQHDLLLQSNLNNTLKVSVNDIYINTLNKQWKIAKRDTLLLLKECNNRYQDGYGLIHLNYDSANSDESSSMSNDDMQDSLTDSSRRI